MTDQPPLRQQRLALLLRSTNGHIRIDDVIHVLGIERQHAAKMLAAWNKQGVIRRVARGLYVPISPASLGQNQVLDDPWEIVPELYSPGYVGGWSALEHWEFTEQLFRSVCVLTSRRLTQGEHVHQGVNFFLKTISAKKMFGTKTIWRGSHKVLVSDPHKTILDIIETPYLGAGLQHTIDSVREFKRQYDGQKSEEKLLEYAKATSVGSLFKKLGFLGELTGFSEKFTKSCAENLTTGYAHLDKSAKNKRLVTRWRLWVPEGIKD